MTTRTEITMMTVVATMCLATSVLLGGFMLVNSVGQNSQSVGGLPVAVHSAAAHGMTVPASPRITTAQIAN
jgi:hypothetical protein